MYLQNKEAPVWTGSRIKSLRKRLGWSAVDLSRRLGCKKDQVYQWEKEESVPDKEVVHQLNYIELQLKDRHQKISKRIHAEKHMKDNDLSQVYIDEIDE